MADLFVSVRDDEVRGGRGSFGHIYVKHPRILSTVRSRIEG